MLKLENGRENILGHEVVLSSLPPQNIQNIKGLEVNILLTKVCFIPSSASGSEGIKNRNF